jgi:ComF family protein
VIALQEIKDSFLHLLFPHTCSGCESDRLDRSGSLCLRCMNALPETRFELSANNPVEKKLWGRVPVQAATAQYYLNPDSLFHRLIHEIKYNGNKELALQLGRMMGVQVKQSNRFTADALVPLPLFPEKERKRGYNQSALLCEAMAQQLQLPVLYNVITRIQHTDTQTHKGRIERWENVEGKFKLTDPGAIAGRHILLVDDVITTGATLEACATELLKASTIQLSIACLCMASS